MKISNAQLKINVLFMNEPYQSARELFQRPDQ